METLLIVLVILFLVFAAYARAAAGAQHEEPELEGPAAFIAGVGALIFLVMLAEAFARPHSRSPASSASPSRSSPFQ